MQRLSHLSERHMHVLAQIQSACVSSPAELAAALHLPQLVVEAILADLEASGLIDSDEMH